MALAIIILHKLSFPKRFVSLPSRFSLKLFSPYSSSSTSSVQNPDQNSEKIPSATWLHHWDPPPPPQEQQSKPVKPPSAIERIVHRLRALEPELEEDEENPIKEASALDGNGKMGELLQRNWTRPDLMSTAGKNLPWEKEVEVEKRKRIRAPTLAELTIEDEELKRLRGLGKDLKEKVTVPKAGLTAVVLDKIHGVWKEKEVVKLKFHEDLAHDMKTAHELVQRRTDGLVIWQSGSFMVVYRGINYKWPSKFQSLAAGSFSAKISNEEGALLTSDVSNTSEETTSTLENKMLLPFDTQFSESITEEDFFFNEMLDGLGPRFVEWWGTGLLPVDADLLPQTIPGYKMPIRMIPNGMPPQLTNAEMTSLRKLAKKLPCHFALGRNRHHQGLASAILKLWEKSLVVKIAIKPGIQNTNSKLMADELKNLTGGVLLLRNKYYVVMYRGKDFLPTAVAIALFERDLTRDVQEVEEETRISSIPELCVEEKEGYSLVGTFARFQQAQARWGRKVTVQKKMVMKEETSRDQSAILLQKLEHKFAIAQSEKLRAAKQLAKIEASMVPINPSIERKMLTDEERSVFRRIGLQMKSYLLIGIHGGFDGVIGNMHLHWKHREMVKLISKQKNLSFVENLARLLEYESGGVLIAIERVPKGFALVYYRGNLYQRPYCLRPKNILTKSKALKHVVAMQRHKALSQQHASELKKTIKQLKFDLGYSQATESDTNTTTIQSGHASDKSEVTTAKLIKQMVPATQPSCAMLHARDRTPDPMTTVII